MKLLKVAIIAVASAGALLVASPCLALTTIGGYVFEDNAFANTAAFANEGQPDQPSYYYWLGPPQGGYLTSPPNPISNAATAVTGSNPGTWAFSLPPYPTIPYVNLGFSGGVVNRPGADLVWFELGSQNNVEICLAADCATRALSLTSPTGYFVTGPTGPLSLNAAEFDLDALSVPTGDSIYSIVAWFDTLTGAVTRPALAAMGANPISVPEPSVLGLLALGLFGVGFSRRRKLH